jgi:hypothetical protein
VALESGHYIPLQQPALVTEAIRQAVAGVRDRHTTLTRADTLTSPLLPGFALPAALLFDQA